MGIKNPIVTIVIMLLIPANCSHKSHSGYPVTYEKIDNILQVSNPAYPKDGELEYKMIEELSIGEDDAADEYIFNRPQQLRVDKNGNIYVLDWGDVNIKVFGPDGTRRSTIGSKGNGPGEFAVPSYFDLTEDGRIIFLDGRNQRITTFDEQGRHQADYRIQGFSSDLHVDSDDRIYFQKQTATGEAAVSDEFQEINYTTTIYRTGPDGDDLTAVGEIAGEKRGVRRTPTGGSMMVSGPHKLIWRVDNLNRLIVGLNDKFSFTIYTADGSPILTSKCGFALKKNPYYTGKSWQHEFLPAFQPYMLIGEDNAIWLQHYRSRARTEEEEVKLRKEPFLYNVFSPEGVYLKQISVPHRISSLANDRAFCIVRDEKGYVSIKRMRFEVDRSTRIK